MIYFSHGDVMEAHHELFSHGDVMEAPHDMYCLVVM
jgi:hypothetical protein